ncbi:putative AMP deaminase [Helianthus anomalus]
MIIRYDLNVDLLDVHTDKRTFRRFDKFNLKYNPCGQSRLIENFLKQDNLIKGRFLGELMKQVLSDLDASKYQVAEYRVSIYGRKQSEWDQLASWFINNSIYSENAVLTQTNFVEFVTVIPQREFLSTWCSYDREPAEEDIVVDFNITLAAGHVLGLASEFNVQHSTWSNCQAPQTPYAIQRSSLLVKVLTNLPCCYTEEDNARFINLFLECLQTESSLPGAAAERTDAARKNLCIYFDFNTSFG